MAVTSGRTSAWYENAWWGKYELYFDWNLVSQSEADNSSTISWSLKYHCHDVGISGGQYIGGNIGTSNYSINVDGNNYSGTTTYSSFTSPGGLTTVDGTTVLKHNPDGTKVFYYSFWQQGINTGAKELSATSEPNTIPTIYRKAHVINAPSFNDENNLTITYSNPAGDSVQTLTTYLSFPDENEPFAEKTITNKTGNQFTLNFTENDRSIIRRKIDSVNNLNIPITVTIKTNFNGLSESLYHSINTTVALINYNPTLSPSVKDVNNRTLELTGDESKFIKYFSNAYFDTSAQAIKEASIEFQRIQCGNTVLDDYTSNTGTIDNIESNTFYFSVTDTRGATTNGFKVLNMIPYVKLTTNLETELLKANGDLTFNISGRYYSGSFGAQNNSMQVDYAVIDENGDFVFNNGPEQSGWVILGEVRPLVDGNNNYSFSHTIEGLDYDKKYILLVHVNDALTPVQEVSTIVAAQPNFDWSGSDFRHHTDVILSNSKSIIGIDANNRERVAFEPCNSNGNLVIGAGGYNASDGNTMIYGNNIRLTTRNEIYINNKKLSDYVIEEASNGTWFYRKWSNGRVELYGYQSISNIACNTALGGWYRTVVISAPSFPIAVINPKCVSNYESDGYGALLWATTTTTESRPASYYLIRPTSSNGITGVVYFYVTGTWE